MLCYAAPAPPTLWQRPSCAPQPPPHHSPSLPGRGPRGRFARPPAQRGDHRGASASQPTHTPPLHMVERGPGDGPKAHHTWHYPCGFGPSVGEASPYSVLSVCSVANYPSPQAVVFPPPPPICPTVGMWQMQDYPGAPGTARQESTRTIVSTYDGGNATQPRAPGHERPRAALRAARHGRLSAATRAPGADVPPATPAGAPGQYCLSAAPRAPGRGRPLATTAGAPCLDRLSAVPAAPDHDRSRARHTMAPGHGRPLAASSGAVGHDRPRATPRAPGADVPPATTAGAPGQHCLSAVAIATAASPAGLRRLRQAVLPRVPATPNTLTYSPVHRINCHSRESENPRPPVATGGPQGGHAPATQAAYSQTPTRLLAHNTIHQVHSAIQVPPRPRSCSTACTGFLRQHPSRAPPSRPPADNPSPPLELAPGEG